MRDYGQVVRVQTRERPEGFEVPVDEPTGVNRDPIAHWVHHLETGAPLIGPLTVEISRLGQRIVDTALESARCKRTLPLLG